MTTNHEYFLDTAEKTMTNSPENFGVFCSRSKCQTLIRPGEVVFRYDAATFTHVNCPNTPSKRFAAHRYTDSGMRMGHE